MSVAARDEHVPAWRHARAIALLPFVNTVVIPGLVLAALPPAQPLPSDAASIAEAVAGVALLAFGVALVVHSIRQLARLGRGTLAPWDPTRELVLAGAYRHSRNPLKGGLFVVLLGEALLARSLPLAVWLASFALVNVVYIRLYEEPGLEARFGDRYRDYRARVPRFWPRLSSLRRRATEVNAA
jgi:protein-S-isoprenylcysteine O-methyltransferase Ste14